jgi:hypothetical protein
MCMAKVLGGSASRAEVYGLFITAVILVGGGVSGAIVLTSGSDSPREAATAVVADPAPGSATTLSATGDGAPTVDTAPSGGSTGSGTAEPHTTVSIAGMTEGQAQIVQDYVDRETEAQRLARVQAEREAFAAANPAGRLISVEILSCPSVPVYDESNPGMLVEIDKLVTYRITYEVFHHLHPESALNPGGLAFSQAGSMQSLRDSLATTWRIPVPRVNLEPDVGVHTGIFYGVALRQAFESTVDVRLRPVDTTYGWVQIEVPMAAPNCS